MEFEPANTSLIIVQPSPFCNIDCKYCYLPDRSNRQKMTLPMIGEIFERVFGYPTVREQVTVVWHAGEPLVLGPSYYDQAISRIAEVTPIGLKVDHSFQTNAMLLNDEWCDLISRWQISVGLSVDGPQHIHDQHRKTRSGRGTFDLAMRGVKLLQARQIPFYVISVLTAAALAEPEAMFDFFCANNMQDVGFNIEELEGINTHSSLQAANQNEAIKTFFSTFGRKIKESGFDIHIRELEEVVNSVMYLDPRGPFNNLVEPFGIITIDVEGNAYTFSPELAGFSAGSYDNFAIGSVLKDSFEDMCNSENLRKMTADIRAGVRECHDTCEYFRICGGGAPSNKIFENGTFRSAATMHCTLTKKEIADYVLSLVDQKAPPAPLPTL